MIDNEPVIPLMVFSQPHTWIVVSADTEPVNDVAPEQVSPVYEYAKSGSLFAIL